MNEFSLIRHYFSDLSSKQSYVELGIGDDAAILDVSSIEKLAVSTDTLVLDTHFRANWPADAIAHRALTANMSDMAAIGATPFAILLNLTLPEVNTCWLDLFKKGLKNQLERYQIALIGGDTTKGPLSISMTIIGKINNKPLLRSEASAGDLIYVTGPLGDCAYALTQLDNIQAKAIEFKKLFYPEPRLEHAIKLHQLATSVIDVSDGLLQDLTHILKEHALGAHIYFNTLPISSWLEAEVGREQARHFALSSGEEYELCFTVARKDKDLLEKKMAKAGLDCYCIGVVSSTPDITVLNAEDSVMDITIEGFQHF